MFGAEEGCFWVFWENGPGCSGVKCFGSESVSHGVSHVEDEHLEVGGYEALQAGLVQVEWPKVWRLGHFHLW